MVSSRPRSRLRGVRRICVLAAAVVSVAGCVGMPSNGPAQEFSASPQSSAPAVNLIGSVPLAPQPGENPSQIVQGFLTAAASYPTYSAARQYLTGSAVKGWKPGLAVNAYQDLNIPASAVPVKASPQVSIDVTGTLQASFNGSGQYISALNPGPAAVPSDYNFTLAKVDGQWRITNPPNYRMLPVSDFPQFYKPQDLYFFDPQDEILVPDSVFVPLGATVSQLLTDLVNSLTAAPKTPWLANAADTALPDGTSVGQQVTNDASTVTVNLTFRNSVTPSPRALELFAAQLVWTLTGSPTSPPNIQSVVLELNGKPWAPPSAPCAGGRNPGLDQTQAAYQCFDPYPSSPASFYYIDRGQSWARCGSEELGLSSLIGPVAPVVGQTGVFSTQHCIFNEGVHEGAEGLPPVQPASLPAVTRTAVSPDGQYLAVVTAGQGDLLVGKLSGPAASFAENAPADRRGYHRAGLGSQRPPLGGSERRHLPAARYRRFPDPGDVQRDRHRPGRRAGRRPDRLHRSALQFLGFRALPGRRWRRPGVQQRSAGLALLARDHPVVRLDRDGPQPSSLGRLVRRR